MTPQGLNELRELATEVDELREQVEKKLVRLLNLYQYEEDVEAREAHSMLIKAKESMTDVIWKIGRATKEMQKAHEFEKDLMDFYEGLLNNLHDDKE